MFETNETLARRDAGCDQIALPLLITTFVVAWCATIVFWIIERGGVGKKSKYRKQLGQLLVLENENRMLHDAVNRQAERLRYCYCDPDPRDNPSPAICASPRSPRPHYSVYQTDTENAYYSYRGGAAADEDGKAVVTQADFADDSIEMMVMDEKKVASPPGHAQSSLVSHRLSRPFPGNFAPDDSVFVVGDGCSANEQDDTEEENIYDSTPREKPESAVSPKTLPPLPLPGRSLASDPDLNSSSPAPEKHEAKTVEDPFDDFSGVHPGAVDTDLDKSDEKGAEGFVPARLNRFGLTVITSFDDKRLSTQLFSTPSEIHSAGHGRGKNDKDKEEDDEISPADSVSPFSLLSTPDETPSEYRKSPGARAFAPPREDDLDSDDESEEEFPSRGRDPAPRELA